MVYPIRAADLFGIVERGRAVTIGENVYMRRWEDFERRFERSSDQVG